MLVKLTDHRGKDRWINPLYVKTLAPRGDAETEIELAGVAAKLRARGTPETIAALIDAATPDLSMPMIVADEAASQAAATAASGGASTAAMMG